MEVKEFKIIRETAVNSSKSLLTIPAGRTVTVACQEFAPFGTVKSSASRLNKRAGRVEFTVTSPDNGATLVITRNPEEEESLTPTKK